MKYINASDMSLSCFSLIYLLLTLLITLFIHHLFTLSGGMVGIVVRANLS